MRIGFIGLGAMGLPMAGHLVAAGHDVTVASRGRGPIDAAVAQGAADGGSPLGVAEASDVIMLCVPNSPEVVEVIEAMLPALGPGKTVIDTSTIDPEVERAQHARVGETGARYLDAPLSGGTAGAQKGTLTLMVGGDAATLADMEPALEPFAGLVVHVGGPGMGQVVKLCNQVIYAAQMTATAEATAMAVRSGVDMEKLLLVLTHATGDCVAVRTRLPVPGVIPESPASNGWQPGFMTDLMAKDLDLAMAYAVRCGVPVPTTATARQLLTAASAAGYGREDFSAVAKVVLALAGAPMTSPPLPTPALILAADHRARAVLTTENWAEFFGSLAQALPSCDGILATAQPLAGLAAAGHLTALHRTYLSINRTGLAGSAFELDDRLVASVPRAAADGWSGVKHMTRIDMDDPITASALELLGQVLEQASAAGLEALIEPLVWDQGRIRRDTDAIVLASVIAHDMGAPVIKVPVPAVAPGAERQRAVARVVASVSVPVLFLGGPRTAAGRAPVLDEVRDVMEGGGAGMAMGRTIYQDPDPAEVAGLVHELVHGR